MIKDFIEEKVSFMSDDISEREEYELLKEIRNKTERRIKELSSTNKGVLYNTLFRSCLEEIILDYMPKNTHPCSRYKEYEKLRARLISDLPYNTHVLVRDEYFDLLKRIKSLGLNVPSKYNEV